MGPPGDQGDLGAPGAKGDDGDEGPSGEPVSITQKEGCSLPFLCSHIGFNGLSLLF